MAVQRMDHVGVVVNDMAAATAFFAELGLEPQGDGSVEGDQLDRIVGLDGARTDFAMLKTPDGRGCVELVKFKAPAAEDGDPRAAANTPGIRHLCFAVDDIEDTLARLRPHGAELVGEVARYEDSYLLCYLRGPSGIILALAQQLS